jgi:hypothetical protein
LILIEEGQGGGEGGEEEMVAAAEKLSVTVHVF